MATVARYVDAPSGAGSANGTSLANAYASITDVTTEDPATGADDLVIYLYGSTDNITGAFTFAPTGNTCTIHVMESTYEINNTSSFRAGIIFARSVDLEGYPFTAKSVHATSPVEAIRLNTSTATVNFNGGVVIDGGSGVSGGSDCYGIWQTAGTINAKNVVITDMFQAGIQTNFFAGAPTLNLDHASITGCVTYGVRRASGTVTVRNSYCGNNATADFSGTITQTTNASSDTTATGTTYDSIAWNTTNFESVTTGDINSGSTTATWGVPTAASGLRDAGTNISVTTDYRGVSRDSTPSIGAVEFAAVASSTFKGLTLLGVG